MHHTLLDVALWPPTASLPCFQDVLYAVVGASRAMGRPLDDLPADPAYFSNGALEDADHRCCLLETLTRFTAVADVESKFREAIT